MRCTSSMKDLLYYGHYGLKARNAWQGFVAVWPAIRYCKGLKYTERPSELCQMKPSPAFVSQAFTVTGISPPKRPEISILSMKPCAN